MTEPERSRNYLLRRREVVKQLLRERGELLVVAGLGAPAWDVTETGDHPLTFPLWGAMGGALAIGLGLSLAQQSRRVLIITGDGELLMGLGSLATIGVQSPSNLAVAVLDNEHYGETGMQTTHTTGPVDLAQVAKASGFPSSWTVYLPEEIESSRSRILSEEGPVFCNIKVKPESLPIALPPREGIKLQKRFREALNHSLNTS